MISLRTHNILDYVIGAVLVLCPFVFGFSEVDAARNIFLILGLGLIGYSLFTNYRYSIAKLIPLGVHMALDVTAGVLLLVSPWLFGYSDRITSGQTWLHVILGLGAVALVTFTRRITESGYERERPTDRIDRAA